MTNTHGLHPNSLRNAAKTTSQQPSKSPISHKLIYGAVVSVIPLFFGLLAFAPSVDSTSSTSKPKKFEVTSGNVAMLALDCANKAIKPILKDPNSFREIRHGYNKDAVNIDVTVEYTATNGFGGRVRNNHTCTYTL